MGVKDDATLEELRAEIMKHLTILAPVLDLRALMAPADAMCHGVKRVMTPGRHRRDTAPTTAALDTVTINRHASPASQPIVVAQPSR
jgi:hypothetical protein